MNVTEVLDFFTNESSKNWCKIKQNYNKDIYDLSISNIAYIKWGLAHEKSNFWYPSIKYIFYQQ